MPARSASAADNRFRSALSKPCELPATRPPRSTRNSAGTASRRYATLAFNSVSNRIGSAMPKEVAISLVDTGSSCDTPTTAAPLVNWREKVVQIA